MENARIINQIVFHFVISLFRAVEKGEMERANKFFFGFKKIRSKIQTFDLIL